MLKTGPGNLGGTSWQDMQKMDTLRKVYQRAVSIPHNATLEIWREYDKFEMGMNKVAVSILWCVQSRDADRMKGSQTSSRKVALLHDRTKRYQCPRKQHHQRH
jgi:hypothetical protein